MINAALMFYGNHALHPWREDMFFRPDLLQRDLKAVGLEFHIACVTHKPTGRDELPVVRLATEPRYDAEGVLLEAAFKPGSLLDYPVIIDHWVANFQDNVIQPDGTVERTAYGIGMPAERLINHKNVQTFGNRKDKMYALLRRVGVAIDTWNVQEIDQLMAKYGDHPVIFKPLGGSQSKGIEVFGSPTETKEALESGGIAKNGLIQPFFDTMQPFEGLVALDKYEAKHLASANARADRAREIRMHILVTTDQSGRRSAKAYPLMKTSAPGTNRLPFFDIVPLHPDAFPSGSYIYDKTIEVGLALAEATGVPHLYGAVDWLYVKTNRKKNEEWLVVDFNCRGPGLPYEAVPVRQGFVGLLAGMAAQNLSH